MPKGTKIHRTLEKEAVIAAYRQRIMKHADNLFNAQYAKAVGSIQIFRVDEFEDENGKKKREHILLTDTDEIKQVLDDTDGTSGVSGEKYYIVAPVLPDGKSIDSMLDRAFGKAQQSVEITENSATKWKQAVQLVIQAKAAKTAEDAVSLLEEVGFNPPNSQIRAEVIRDLGNVG